MSKENRSFFTDLDFYNAERYALLAAEQAKYKLAKAAFPKFMAALRIKDIGRKGWRDHNVFIENDQEVENFLDIVVDSNVLDCEAVSCHPNDMEKLSNQEKSIACDFWTSRELTVKSGGVKYKACQSACFEMDMEIDKDTGKPVPKGNLFIHRDGEDVCRVINQQLLTYATVPISRYSASGKTIEGYNSSDVPPYRITDDTYSRFEITYEYCQYFLKSFDELEKDCYTSTGSNIAQFLLGRVITNFFFDQDIKALRQSAPCIYPSGPTTAEKLNIPLTNNKRLFNAAYFKEKLLRSDEKSGGLKIDENNDVLQGLLGEMTVLFVNLVIQSEILGVDERELKRMFLDEIASGNDEKIKEEGEDERIKLWLSVFFYFRQFILNKFQKKFKKKETKRKGTTEAYKQQSKTNNNSQMIDGGKITSAPPPPLFENYRPRFFINFIEISKYEGGGSTDMKSILHRPQNNSFWSDPLKNIAHFVFEEAIAFYTGFGDADFQWQDNIFANLGVDIAVDVALSKAGSISQKVFRSLTRETIEVISSKAARYGTHIGAKLLSRSVASIASRAAIKVVIKTGVRIALNMLKLLASLSMVAFNVLSAALLFFSIVSLVLDLIFQQAWLDEIRSKEDLEIYISAHRDNFRESMNLVNSETAPFTPKDIIDYIIDAQMRRNSSSENDAFSSSPFAQTEDELYLKYYYDYLNSRTVNSLGQPISFVSAEKQQQQNEAKAIMQKLTEVAKLGSLYSKPVCYNAPRIPFLTIDEYEECYLSDKVSRQNIELEKIAQNIVFRMGFVGVLILGCFAIILMDLNRFFIVINFVFIFVALYFFLFTLLLIILHQIDVNNLTFINQTALFDFSKKDDLGQKGALKYLEVQKNISKFLFEFMKPFKDEIFLKL